MPCYEVRQTTVDVEFKDLETLTAGLRQAGYSVRATEGGISFRRAYDGGSYQAGKLSLFGPNLDVNAVKRAYAAETVRRSASKYGWALDEKTPGRQYTAQKRY